MGRVWLGASAPKLFGAETTKRPNLSAFGTNTAVWSSVRGSGSAEASGVEDFAVTAKLHALQVLCNGFQEILSRTDHLH
jgi:hypothetical protein